MAQFVAATSPSGEASYLINPDKIIYIMQTLTGESVLHFGEDETLHIGMKPQEFIERAGRDAQVVSFASHRLSHSRFANTPATW